MSREPSNKDDAPAEAPASGAESQSAKKSNSNRTRQIVTGAAIGIGSAALVAALLYANRNRRGGGKA
jgi:hypothetical protein